MKELFLLLTAIALGQTSFAQYNYPVTKTVDSTDTYWGVTLHDPYRWLEDIKNPEVEKWFKAEADYTNLQMAKIPNQDKLINELKALNAMQSASYTPIAKAGGKYFYKKRMPGEQVAKLYYKQGENGKEIFLFDPQKYVEGKTYDCNADVSADGSKILLGLSEGGAEVYDLRIMDVATGKLLPDIIQHTQGGSFVGKSNTDILYIQNSGYDVHDPSALRNLPAKLHIAGTPYSSDIVIASSEKYPELISSAAIPQIETFQDCPFIFLNIMSVDKNLTLYYAPKSEMKSDNIHWKPLTTPEDKVVRYYAQENDLYFYTSKDNPHYSIKKTNLDQPDLDQAKSIAEGNSEWNILEWVFVHTKDYLIFNKVKNGLVVKPYSYEFKTGKISEINVPLKGNISGAADFRGNKIIFSKDDNEILLINVGWTIPLNYYGYDVKSKKLRSDIFTSKYDYPNLENLVYEEVEAPSWDGTLVPMSIVYDKTKLKKDGSNICLMEGYGAYGFPVAPPILSVGNLTLLNRGVVMAYAHVRGGFGKGSEWHLAGMKTTKPNTWKDFIACAEYLIKNKFTSSEKLAAEGASAGGILIGRTITERPDLFKAVISRVGDMNALRSEFTPSGPANIPEFGTVTIEEEFKALLEMDAYQHIQKGVKYPAQLITTGWNDPRVTSYIPAKFAAKMQNDNGSENPVFLDVNYAGGHFGGSSADEQFAETAKKYAFILWQCGDKEFQL